MQHPAGFADPARDGARSFRAALAAMAQPGAVSEIGLPSDPPPPLSHAAAALLLTLTDTAASVWLARDCHTDAVAAFLRLHCGAPPAATARDAAFAAGRWDALRSAGPWRMGDPDYPDRSTTLIVEVDDLSSEEGMRLTGPGIRGEARLGVAGVDRDFWAMLAANAKTAPLGLDVFLTAGRKLAALPRSVRIAE